MFSLNKFYIKLYNLVIYGLFFIFIQSKVEISKFLTKEASVRLTLEISTVVLQRLISQYLKRKRIPLNYTGLKSKAMSKTIFILHISILNIVYKN